MMVNDLEKLRTELFKVEERLQAEKEKKKILSDINNAKNELLFIRNPWLKFLNDWWFNKKKKEKY